jgi:hypothetical protein
MQAWNEFVCRVGSRSERVTEQADRTFSRGEPVGSIETEKKRVVVHELEKNWWILAVSSQAASDKA